MKIPKNVIILEMSWNSPNPETYQVEVKCHNCGVKYSANIKKGITVKEHQCYNCNQKTLYTV
jgi:DNA-directed RNA polymerase subunit RPC12/RpoP